MAVEKGQPVLVRSASNREGGDLSAEDMKTLRATDLKSASVTLYQFDQSPPCWKVRALLHYYEMPYTSVTAYPGSKVEGMDNAYHKIPKLKINDLQINDSAVIYRTLGAILAGEPLTAAQVELEARNNISGLLGALEKETASSYFGIVNAVQALTSDWSSWKTALVKPVLPYVAGLIFPLPKMIFTFGSAPHGRDGPSLVHGRVYQQALADQKYFHGEKLGLLDLSLYGTLACFEGSFRSPAATAVIDQCGLREWYQRVDAVVRAVRPLDA